MRKKTKDLIDEFVAIVEPWCDAPINFIEAGGYHLVSDCLGRFFYAPGLPQEARPNLWMILSSIPGRMRRSSVQHYVDYVRKKALTQFYEGTTTLSATEIKQLIRETTIEEGTPEGIADQIQDADQDVFAVESVEIGTVFLRTQDTSYMSGVLGLFSKLYYGEGGAVSLSRRGGKKGIRLIPEGLFVTLFAGMQEPWLYIKRMMIRQGLLRRLMILYVEKNPRHLPPVNPYRGQIYDDLRLYAKKLAKLMLEFNKETWHYSRKHQVELIPMEFFPSVLGWINTLSGKLDATIDEGSNDLNIYNQSLWEHQAKLAMVRRIAAKYLEKLGSHPKPGMQVRVTDYKRAEEFLDPITEKTETVIDNLDTTEAPLPSFETHLQKLYRKIAVTGDEGLVLSKTYNALKGVKSKQMNELLGTLIIQGKIERAEVQTGGRPKTVYKAVR